MKLEFKAISYPSWMHLRNDPFRLVVEPVTTDPLTDPRAIYLAPTDSDTHILSREDKLIIVSGDRYIRIGGKR